MTWFGIRRQNQQRARRLIEIEILDEIVELRHIFAHVRGWIGATKRNDDESAQSK